MREPRKLLVKLSDEEMHAVEKEHSDVCLALSQIDERKKEVDAKFREEKKPFELRRKALEAIKKNSGEMRDVECEVRELPEQGLVEVVRLDTGDVVDTLPLSAAETRQPGLPFSRPEAPKLLCSALDNDGVAYAITVEQADAAERAIAESGSARVEVDGDTYTVTRVLRGKACSFCGIVGGHHRPECDSMRADEASEDDTPESYDPNDTAAVAAKIDEIEPPPDGLVRGVETATRKVKPKRAKKSAAAEPTEAEGVH